MASENHSHTPVDPAARQICTTVLTVHWDDCSCHPWFSSLFFFLGNCKLPVFLAGLSVSMG